MLGSFQASVLSVPPPECYVWGDPATEISVLFDGKIITATQNPKDALLQLKLKDRS
jgi:hypothetical protein